MYILVGWLVLLLTLAAPVQGSATWYCGSTATCTKGYGPGDMIAAIDRKDTPFEIGDRVTVRSGGRSVTVTIRDVCACGGNRIIDLSRGAFARLADPSLGVIPVTLVAADGVRPSADPDPLPTAPATDVE